MFYNSAAVEINVHQNLWEHSYEKAYDKASCPHYQHAPYHTSMEHDLDCVGLLAFLYYFETDWRGRLRWNKMDCWSGKGGGWTKTISVRKASWTFSGATKFIHTNCLLPPTKSSTVGLAYIPSCLDSEYTDLVSLPNGLITFGSGKT